MTTVGAKRYCRVENQAHDFGQKAFAHGAML
jgi:hypothetical protein